MASRIPSREGEYRIIADTPCSLDVLVDRPIDVFANKEKCDCPKAAATRKSAQQSSLISSPSPSPVVKKRACSKNEAKVWFSF